MHGAAVIDLRGAGPWASVDVPVVAPHGWTRTEMLDGIREIERIRRRVDAAGALLIGGLGATGRDTASLVAGAAGVSYRAAKDQARVAEVIGQIDGAAEALASGTVSVEHLKTLAPVATDPDASGLLAAAGSQSPEELFKTVARFQLDGEPAGVRKRQHGSRCLSFFKAEHGCLGMRAVFPPIEGEELRNRLTAIADAAWRAAHPERAATLGGYEDAEPYTRRLADALITLARGGAGREQTGGGGGGGKPSVVVVIDAGTMEAEVIGQGPVPLQDALELAARAELYACVRDTKWGTINFGRNRRLATPLQQLALTVRDRGCVYPKCDQHWTRTEAHHIVDFQDGGLTDLTELALQCRIHHPHLHVQGLELYRDDNGEWDIRPRTTGPPPDPG